MKPFVTIPLLLVASVAQAASYSAPDTDPPLYKGDRPVYGERIIELPEDGRSWHVVVFTSVEMNPRERAILSWFDDNPELNKLKRQTHFHHYTPRSSLWPRYYNATNPMLRTMPCVVLETSEGNIVARFSGTSSHLDTDDTLLRAMVACINAYRVNPGGCPLCPSPTPYTPPYTPSPDPFGPFPNPGPPDIGPDNTEVPLTEEKRHLEWLGVAAAVFVLVLGFAYIRDRQVQTY